MGGAVMGDRWQCHMPAQIPELVVIEDREVGRRTLNELLAARFPYTSRGNDWGQVKNLLPCWRDTPELFRRMVAHAAGLDRDVVAKLDRDLTEAEKSKLRQAARELRAAADSLVTL